MYTTHNKKKNLVKILPSKNYNKLGTKYILRGLETREVFFFCSVMAKFVHRQGKIRHDNL
jgi:hypothetical protein